MFFRAKTGESPDHSHLERRAHIGFGGESNWKWPQTWKLKLMPSTDLIVVYPTGAPWKRTGRGLSFSQHGQIRASSRCSHIFISSFLPRALHSLGVRSLATRPVRPVCFAVKTPDYLGFLKFVSWGRKKALGDGRTKVLKPKNCICILIIMRVKWVVAKVG